MASAIDAANDTAIAKAWKKNQADAKEARDRVNAKYLIDNPIVTAETVVKKITLAADDVAYIHAKMKENEASERAARNAYYAAEDAAARVVTAPSRYCAVCGPLGSNQIKALTAKACYECSRLYADHPVMRG